MLKANIDVLNWNINVFCPSLIRTVGNPARVAGSRFRPPGISLPLLSGKRRVRIVLRRIEITGDRHGRRSVLYRNTFPIPVYCQVRVLSWQIRRFDYKWKKFKTYTRRPFATFGRLSCVVQAHGIYFSFLCGYKSIFYSISSNEEFRADTYVSESVH